MKKFNLIKYFAFTIGLVMMVSCDKGLEDLNVDPNEPTSAPAVNLVTQAQQVMMNRVWSRVLNAEWGMLMVQQWSQNEYAEESRYAGIDANDFDASWISFYANQLNELQTAKDLILASETVPAVQKANQVASLDIMMAFIYHNLVDMFGDIPMSQALNSVEFPLPAYDNQSTIYLAILDMLQNAANSIDAGEAGFGAGDIIFGGDMAAWKRLANSLVMRAAMRIIDTDQSSVASAAITAASAGAIASNDENAVFAFDPNPDIANPLYIDNVVNTRDDFCASKLLVDHLVNTNDPRLPSFVAKTLTDEYVGMPYGLLDGDAFALKSTCSRPADALRIASAPAVIIDYAEIAFITAEARERGILSGSAEDAYNAGVAASLNYWGTSDQPTVDAYIAANGYDAANWKESIGTQKWLAFYMNGPQAWAEQRRLDFPALTASADNENNGIIPVRLPYPISEQTRNSTNLSAVTGTPNDINTRLWWDQN